MTGSIAVALLAAYLLVGEPWFGRHSHRRMLAALDGGVPAARSRFYRQWTGLGWALLAVTLIVTLGLAGWTPAELGLRLPNWPHLPASGHDGSPGFAGGLLVGVMVALAVGVAVGVGIAWRRRRGGAPDRQQRVPVIAGNRNLMRMLPRTREERLAFAALAVTAGVTEEVIWRGFGLTLLLALLPGWHPAVPIALAALAFGWAHLYQGVVGMFATAMIGAVLATLFWASGSLLWPILIHVMLDLRVLLVRAPVHAPEV